MKIAICSCADYRTPTSHNVWKKIREEEPDLLLLLGDNIYLPQEVNPNNVAELRAALTTQYDRLLSDANFQELVAFMGTGGRRVAAIYDDHDSIGEDLKYAVMTPAMRAVAQELLFQKLAFAASPPNLFQSIDTAIARVIMLDTRSFRIDEANTLDDVLGAAQAAWFRAQVAASLTKPYLLVCSGFTLHRYSLFVSSGWFFHQGARHEVTSLLGDRPGVLFASGDIHENTLKMKSGVIELVSSGVARKQVLGSAQLRNYAIVDLNADGATVSAKALKPTDEWSRTISLADWRI